MKPRTLLILLVLVAGLGAFVWLHERKLPNTRERAEQAKKVLALKPDEVRTIALEAAGKTVRLERPAESKPAEAKPADAGSAATAPADTGPAAEPPARAEWRITAPIIAAADGFEIDRLLGTLADLDKQRTIDDFDPAQLGLDKPRAKVTLGTAAESRVLLVGAQLPSSDSTIVALEGDKQAFVVTGGFVNDVKRAAGDWRDKVLFHGNPAAIQSVRLTPETGISVLLARRGDDYWLESPLSDRADKAAAEPLVSRLAGLKATRFVDEVENDGGLGLAPPAGTIEVVLEGQPLPFRLEIGGLTEASSTARYARADGQLAVIDTDFLADLGKSAEAWRSLAVTAFSSWAVESAKVTDRAGTVDLHREGGEWQRDGVEIPYTEVGDFLSALTELKADRFAAAGEEPSATETMSVELAGKDGKAETVRFLPLGKDGVAVRSGSRAVWLVLPATRLREVQEKLAAVRAAQPVPKAEKAGEAQPGDAKAPETKPEGER